MKKRMANLELLRTVSMLLVIVLHFLNKGGSLTDLKEPAFAVSDYLVWILESLAIVAVNAYMLLSGYLLTEGTFRVERLIRLILQVWFYSVGIGAAALALGILPREEFNIYYLFNLVFPITKNQYWFMTAYVYMYLFAPLLGAGVRRLTPKQHRLVLGLALLAFSVSKSILPFRLETDQAGYDCIWFLCVFLTASYIRLHGVSFFKNAGRGLLVYLLAAAGIFGLTLGYRYVYLRTGRLSDMLTVCYEYNHILVLTAAVGFFYLFYRTELKDGWFSRLILRIAPYTLGVYLWHEHIALRYRWEQWLYAVTGEPKGVISLLLLTLFAVSVVFVIGIAIDICRTLLFKGLDKALLHIGLYKKCRESLGRPKIPAREEKTE